MATNYYRVMGLPPRASTSEIKTRYKQLAKLYHPDLKGDTQKMSLINRAYSVLSDPKARFEYNKMFFKTPRDNIPNSPFKNAPKPKPKASPAPSIRPITLDSLFKLILNPVGVFAILLMILLVMGLLSSGGSRPLTAVASTSGKTHSLAQRTNNRSTHKPIKSPPVAASPVSQTTTSATDATESVSSAVAGLPQACALEFRAADLRKSQLQLQINNIQTQLAIVNQPVRNLNYLNPQTANTILLRQLAIYQKEMSAINTKTAAC